MSRMLGVDFRKVFITFLISLICQAVLAGCVYPGPVETPSPQAPVATGSYATPPTLSPLPAPSYTPIPSRPPATLSTSPQVFPSLPTPTLGSSIAVPARYNLEAVFDYEGRALSVDEIITYQNLTSDTLFDLLLVVEPNLVPGGFSLLSLTWQDGQAVSGYELIENQIRIPLPRPFQRDEIMEIRLKYQLAIPELADMSVIGRPVAYGYSDRQTNLVDWYVYVPPYREGTGWLTHPVWNLGEYQVFDIADFQVTLTLARPVPGLVLAASAPPLKDGDRYTYHLSKARAFALSASTEYLVQSITVGDVAVLSYSFPYDKHAGQDVLYSTADALQLYSQLILPYYHASLSIVEADFLDGMEYDGLFFLSHGFYDLYDGTPKGYLTFISAHETAHQWWYGLVGNDQALEPWLDEALCTYMELIYYESLYSDAPPHTSGSLVNWWWSYRVNFYDPYGWVDSPIYAFEQSRSYRDAVYLNGAIFLEDLRTMIKDQAFFGFLKDYASRNAFSIASEQDFFAILKAHTTRDLSPLLSTYFRSDW